MVEITLRPLFWLLEHMDEFSASQGFNKYLYLVGNYPWNKDSLGTIYYGDAASEFDPEWGKAASQIGLNIILDVELIRDILSVAQSQIKRKDTELEVQSFNFYYKRDSFLKIPSDSVKSD